MLLLLFVLLVGGALFMAYYFTNQIYNQKKQILLLKQQNNNLNRKVKWNKDSNLIAQYITPNFTEAFVNNNCELYICPMDNSVTLNSLSKNTSVKILCSVKIKNELWYEISITSSRNVNNRGWIKDKFISSAVN